ncbi:GNAT family N-acetyltransferase [Clostridiaceae bacterium HSG29]|nr:GNAT family N-acetyltransferase [Clostridiaceae bacterium HSG29]
MNICLRESNSNDFLFLNKMLYEAVFWRESNSKPLFEEGILLKGVKEALIDFKKREGDIAVVALNDSVQIGAAWFRYYNEKNQIRGYIDNETPVLVIAVHQDYRHKKIGGKMIKWLIEYASKQNIERISLCVSKDNYAFNLYKQQGFKEYKDIGDSLLMIYDFN